ncbi:MAG: sigma-70 family RNA polymerase sigma factor [Acidimicrobiia bacterium]
MDLYERFYRPVYAYCRRRTMADVVDDVVADTFLTAWRRIDDVPDDHEALPWLYGVAYRVLGNQRRGSARRRKLDERLASIGHPAPSLPHEVIVMGEESRQVLAALDSLRLIDREVLRLSAWEELPQVEIALVLDISVEAVRQRLHQAKRRLAKAYDRLDRARITPAAQKGGAR